VTRAAKTRVKNEAAHITTGNVLEDLGFAPAHAAALKRKAEVLDAILEEIAAKKYTAKDLVVKLDEYQPQVSNLMRGNISKVSLEKLLAYCDRLGIAVAIALRPAAPLKSEQTAAEATVAWHRGPSNWTKGPYPVRIRRGTRARAAERFPSTAKSRYAESNK
jgi:predicted XRE-type DNA-binding protein